MGGEEERKGGTHALDRPRRLEGFVEVGDEVVEACEWLAGRVLEPAQTPGTSRAAQGDENKSLACSRRMSPISLYMPTHECPVWAFSQEKQAAVALQLL